MSSKIKIVQLGLGFIGKAVHDILSERPQFEIMGAVDPDPAVQSRFPDVPVSPSLDQALQGQKADVAVLTTTSRMDTITPQVLALIDQGLHVVSTCEELVYPWKTDPEWSAQIDEAAKNRGVSVLSTGVNPGFLMDFLPIIVSRIGRRVDRIVVERVQDARPRRAAFQKKIGASMTTAEFAARVAEGNFGHAGLTASVQLLAAGLGWDLDSTEETIEPITSRHQIITDHLTVEPGNVAGVYQTGIGSRGGVEVIQLRFTASVGESESYDRIQVFGKPDLETIFPKGVPGDIATGAITVSAIPALFSLQPGLHTMADLWPAG